MVKQGDGTFVASLQYCFFSCQSDCTAVVINSWFLLTTAACAESYWNVTIGVTNLPSDNETAQVIHVDKAIPHDRFNRYVYHHVYTHIQKSCTPNYKS